MIQFIRWVGRFFQSLFLYDSEVAEEILGTKEYPGPWTVDADPRDREAYRKALEERNEKIRAWEEANRRAY